MRGLWTAVTILGLIMPAMAQPASGQVYQLEDGDEYFQKVNDRDAPQVLPPGVAAAAMNQRFENGQCLPRYGVGSQEWGRVDRGLVSQNPVRGIPQYLGAHTSPPLPPATWNYYQISGFIVGRTYYAFPFVKFTNPAEGVTVQAFAGLTTQAPSFGTEPTGPYIQPGLFVATATTYYLYFYANNSVSPTDGLVSDIYQVQNPRGYSRWTAEDGTDNCVLLTDDPRDQAGEDGGVGRAWRINPGNIPQAIPLNGQDVWGECRLIPCLNGLILLRHGNERHYFGAAAVNTSTGVITLNGPQAWNNAELVLFNIATPASQLYGAQPNTQYYVKNVTATTIKLYTDSGLSTQLTFPSSPASVGTFYLERQAVNPGAYGNVPPGLLMQNTSSQTSFQAGFSPAPVNCAITATNGTTHLVTAPNHRLVPGDQVTLTGITASSTPVTTAYACPLSPGTLFLFTTEAEAIAGGVNGGTGLILVDGSLTGTLQKQAASGVPMPGGREGIYLLQRVIIVNGFNNILISDPVDPLHFTPMTGTITANLGDNESVVAVHPLAYDTLLIGFNSLILALQNLSQAQANWALVEVTREYGWTSPLSVTHVGSDVWAVGRKGVVSIQQTEFGQISGVALPVSDEIRNTLGQVLWSKAGSACAQSWNNRFFVGLPFRSQPIAPGATILNNTVLTYSTINQGWETGGGTGWTGPFMNPKAFARLKIDGDERLTWVDQATGFVCWYSDDFTDSGLDIQTSLTTRAYFHDRQVLALPCLINWDTFAPSLTVSWKNRSYNSGNVMASGFTYSDQQYSTTKPPDNDFTQPDRQDYSMNIDAGLYSPGVPFDVHQNHIEPFWLRARGRSPQLVIANAKGSSRVNSVQIYANPVGLPARSQT